MGIERALLTLWGLYGGECEHGIGTEPCSDCPKELNEVREQIRACAWLDDIPAPRVS